jgi:alanyl-tRNA synthetase
LPVGEPLRYSPGALPTDPFEDRDVTRRLYYEDSSLRSFEAGVVESRLDGEATLVRLDATAFYPGGGGQPADRGHLGGRTVIDATLEGDEVWHRLDGPLEHGARVTGTLDWNRRFDHMQQHTGQHVLSRAFVEIAKADTRSFHLGETVVTIDVDHPGPDADLLRRIEQRANEVIGEDRVVTTHRVSAEEARAYPLRKAPDVEGEVRVVEVEGFDWSACGGTHVQRSAQIGVLAILGTERYKGGTRVAFACGGRVRARLHQATDRLRALCLEFTAGEEDLPRAIARLKEEQRRLEARIKPLLAESIAREADALLDAAERGASGPVVARYFPERDPAELASLAGRVTERGGIANLAAGRDIARAHFSAPKGTIAVGAIFADLVRVYGAKGGGRPESAQGAIPAARAAEAIDEARRAALAGMERGPES